MGVTTVHRGHWIPGWWDRLIGVGVTIVHRGSLDPRLVGQADWSGGHHCSQGVTGSQVGGTG